MVYVNNTLKLLKKEAGPILADRGGAICICTAEDLMRRHLADGTVYGLAATLIKGNDIILDVDLWR